MQIQEMFWKQKYDNLEENYKSLKCEYDKIQNTTKIGKLGDFIYFLKYLYEI